MAHATSLADSSSTTTSKTAPVLCPMCGEFLKEGLQCNLGALSQADLLALKEFLESQSFKLYRSILLRSRVDVLRMLESAECEMEIFRLQGRLRQLRDLEAVPQDIDNKLEEFRQEIDRVTHKRKLEEEAAKRYGKR